MDWGDGGVPSHLRALVGSWSQPWKSSLLRAKAKKIPFPRLQASQVEDSQQQIQLDLENGITIREQRQPAPVLPAPRSRHSAPGVFPPVKYQRSLTLGSR